MSVDLGRPLPNIAAHVQPPVRASGGIWSIAVARDGRWMVSGDDRKKATVWNVATHEKVLDTEHKSYVYAVDVSSDSTNFNVAARHAHYADNVRMIDIPSGTELLPLPLSHPWPHGVKFSPGGSYFATASYNSGVRVCRTHEGNVLFDPGSQGSTVPSSSSLVTPLSWSSDGQ